ncbi:MAG: hypothetical protein KGR26_16100 [Cyanobacteria bacterium REEB65]|nr:hypothetical protein [Cyanobacteria bacterium REEB65]
MHPDQQNLLEEQVACLKRLYEAAESGRKVELQARVAAEQWVQNLLTQVKDLQEKAAQGQVTVALCKTCRTIRLDPTKPCVCGSVDAEARSVPLIR